MIRRLTLASLCLAAAPAFGQDLAEAPWWTVDPARLAAVGPRAFGLDLDPVLLESECPA